MEHGIINEHIRTKYPDSEKNQHMRKRWIPGPLFLPSAPALLRRGKRGLGNEARGLGAMGFLVEVLSCLLDIAHWVYVHVLIVDV